MLNLNKIFAMPVLQYKNTKDIDYFEKKQLEKLLEEIEEFKTEDIRINKSNKICELLDILQVVLSFLELFSKEEIKKASTMHKSKLEARYKLIGKYEIYQFLNKK